MGSGIVTAGVAGRRGGEPLDAGVDILRMTKDSGWFLPPHAQSKIRRGYRAFCDTCPEPIMWRLGAFKNYYGRSIVVPAHASASTLVFRRLFT